MNLSSSLESSSQLPVSVYSTGCLTCFSWKKVRHIITSSEESVYYHHLNSDFNAHPSVRNDIAFPSRLLLSRYQNINWLSIHYPIWVRVRSWLTLSWLAWLRKPEFFGGGVSRTPNRYLCLHFRFYKLQQTSQFTFNVNRMLPYPLYNNAIASVIYLCPIIIHARPLD